VMQEFDSVIGFKYLKALHLNNSKGGRELETEFTSNFLINISIHLGAFDSKLDRHENIGKGQLGKDCFRRIMNDPRFYDMPLILETPETAYETEVALLYSLVDS